MILFAFLAILREISILGTKTREEATDDINAMMLSSLNDEEKKIWFCGVCNYTNQKFKVFNHVDSKHYEYGLNCEICGKMCSTFRGLTVHKQRYHPGEK